MRSGRRGVSALPRPSIVGRMLTHRIASGPRHAHGPRKIDPTPMGPDPNGTSRERKGMALNRLLGRNP